MILITLMKGRDFLTFLHAKKTLIIIAAILCFLSVIITVINFFTLTFLIEMLPFSIIRVIVSVFYIQDGFFPLVISFIIISILLVILSGIDLLKFKKHIIFPFLALCLYLFDLWMIVVPNYFQGLYAFVPNAITDVIMIAALVAGIICKKRFIKSTIKNNVYKEGKTDIKI